MIKGFVAVLTLMWLVTVAMSQNQPEVVFQKAPDKYPPAALAIRVSGDVLVKVEIDAKGNVISTKLLQGHPLLNATSIQAAKEWRFQPSINSKVRAADILFQYSREGWFTIEDGEVELETRTQVKFEAPNVVRILAGTYVPKLLLLPRKDGVIENKFCSLHDHLMETEVQKIHYGLLATNVDRSGFQKKFERAEKKHFPYANVDAYGGCMDNGVEEMELYYCSICRIRRSEWLKKNEQSGKQ